MEKTLNITPPDSPSGEERVSSRQKEQNLKKKKKKKKKQQQQAKCYRDIEKLKQQLEVQKRRAEMYKKRWFRLNASKSQSSTASEPETPRTKTRNLLRHYPKK